MARHSPQRFAQTDDKTPTAQENRIAGKLGGKRVRGSGASMYSKGDVRGVALSSADTKIEFLVECKKTEKNSLILKWEWLRKITYEAMAKEKEPALTIEIQGNSDPNVDRDWILVPVRILEKLRER